MTQKKAHEVEMWIGRPDATPIVLLYGPDHGLVAERAKTYAVASGLPLDDPFTVVRLEAAEADETGRLIDEANTVSMFAGRRLIWVRGAGAHKRFSDDVKQLAENPPLETVILIEAGDLKKGAGLRSIVEASRNAIALPCYADGARELDALIDKTMGAAGLTLTLPARALLKQSLGGDRMASRSELDKLTLYAMGQGSIDVADIADLTGDMATLSIDAAIDAAVAGDIAEFDRQFVRFCNAGGQPFLAINSAMRVFQMLRLMRSDMEQNRRTAAAAIEQVRPPVHFSRKRTLETALTVWSTEAADRALARLMDALLESRRRADLSEVVVGRALLALTAEARGRLNRH